MHPELWRIFSIFSPVRCPISYFIHVLFSNTVSPVARTWASPCWGHNLTYWSIILTNTTFCACYYMFSFIYIFIVYFCFIMICTFECLCVFCSFPDVEFFKNSDLHTKMTDALFCYSRLNQRLSYRQVCVPCTYFLLNIFFYSQCLECRNSFNIV